MRVEFELDSLQSRRESLLQTFESNVAARYHMNWRLALVSDVKKVGILVSKVDHALLELLWRHARGGLPCEITKVVSNHETLREAVENFGIPFEVVPVTKENKREAYAKINELMQGNDLLVLARYMQVLSDDMCRKLAGRAINIHHSFLPSFKGAKPYYQAHDRGVKLIGATAHYVTADLDEGPIIEQDVARADHTDTVEDLTARGRDTESLVLARAVKWHSEHRVLLNGHRTVVFR